MWDRRDVECLQSQDLPWEPVPEGELGATGTGLRRVLSRDPVDGAVTTVQRFTDPEHGVLDSELDVYVLSGAAMLNGQLLRPGTYVHAPQGSHWELVPQPDGFVAYCGYWGPPTLFAKSVAPDDARIVRTGDLRWEVPEWSGETELEPGAAVKWLRREEGAIVYLAAMLPGWKCPSEEAHPVYEESFKLTGSILMGDRGLNREGSYFFRSPNVFHGPLYSQDGTMSFIRSDAPTTTEYRETQSGRGWRELAEAAYGSRGHAQTF